VVTHEMCVGMEIGCRLFIVMRTKIDKRREMPSLNKPRQYLNTVAILTMHAAEQNDVVACTRELVWQMSGRHRVVGRNNRIRPIASGQCDVT